MVEVPPSGSGNRYPGKGGEEHFEIGRVFQREHPR
jgi:hypothetical protein